MQTVLRQCEEKDQTKMTIFIMMRLEPLGKMDRIELDDSDDQSSVCLPSDLNNFVGKYARKHIGNKTLKSVS